MLMAHAVCQPHKQNIHNIIDSFLLGNLLLINTLSMYHLYRDLYPRHFLPPTCISASIQIALMYIPLLVAVLIWSKRLFNFFKDCTGRVYIGDDLNREDSDSLLEMESIRSMDSGGAFVPCSGYSIHPLSDSTVEEKLL